MKKIVWIHIITLCSLIFAALAAADVRVSLEMDRTETTLADTARMEVTISGAQKSDTKPAIEGLDSFHVSRSGTSSRVEVVNGKVSSKLTYTYFLQPCNVGTYKIGPAEIQINGRKMQSNQVMLSVTETRQPPESDRGHLFVEADLSSHEAYLEEQVIYTIKLYRRIRVDDLSLQLPDIDHIAFKQLGSPRRYQSTLAGKTYQVLEIRHALWATKPGTFVIEPSRLNMIIQKPQPRNTIDDFFNDNFFRNPFSTFTSGQPLNLATPSLELDVAPLPQNGRPADFNGLVGDFQMTSTLVPGQLEVGEPATLTVRITGRGNINRIPDLNMPELSFARVYDDQPVLETQTDNEGFGGTKTMKWAVVPEQAGRFELPNMVLGFFNPDTNGYSEINSGKHILNVLPGERKEMDVPRAPINTISPKQTTKQAIKNIGKDILPIHTAVSDLSPPFKKWFSGWRLWVSLCGPLTFYLLFTGMLLLRQRSPQLLAQNKEKNAFKAFTRRCRRGYAGHAELIASLRDYLNDRFGISLGALTTGDIDTVLQSKGVNPSIIDNACDLVQRIEQTIYSGESHDLMETALDLERLVRRLDKETR